MKKLLLFLSLFFGISLYAQVLPNGGFEATEAGSNTAENWFFMKSSGAAEFTIIDTAAYEGTKCLYVNIIEKATGNFWDIQTVYENFAAEPETYYRASFYIRSPQGFRFRAALGRYIDYRELASGTFTVNNNWTRISLVAYNDTNNKLRVPINAFEQGQYFIDAMSIIPSPIGGAIVVPTGDSIIIQSPKQLETIPSNFDLGSFTVTVNDQINPVKKVVNITANKAYFALLPTNIITKDAKVNISHTGGKLFFIDTNGVPEDNLPAFEELAINNSLVMSTNVYSLAENTLYIYPNPANDFIMLKQSSVSSVKIYTLQGSLVKSFYKVQSQYNIADLLPGIYMLQVKNNQGHVYTSKFVKK